MRLLNCIICLILSSVCYGQTLDSLVYRIHFEHNSSVFDPARPDNQAAIYGFARDMDIIRHKSGASVCEISVRGYASLDGSYFSNLYLGRRRAQSVIDYLKDNFGLDASRKEPLPLESDLARIVSRTETRYKEDIVRILESEENIDARIQSLKSLDSGRCWDYLDSVLFPKMKRADIVVLYSIDKVAAAPVPVPVVAVPVEPEPQPEPQFEPEPEPVPVVVDVPEVVPETRPEPEVEDPSRDTSYFFLALKNNLVYDAALVANLGLEFGLGKHFSLDIPVTYSPYTVSQNYRMRTLSVQPELRYYFKKGCYGHFFGLHGNLAYYNVTTPFNTDTRFQDRDGVHPLYGGGISYGYSLPFKKEGRFGIEFTVGAGYAYLDYDCFYNVENGAWFNKETKHYWGIDKVGLTLYYRFIDSKKKKK